MVHCRDINHLINKFGQQYQQFQVLLCIEYALSLRNWELATIAIPGQQKGQFIQTLGGLGHLLLQYLLLMHSQRVVIHNLFLIQCETLKIEMKI